MHANTLKGDIVLRYHTMKARLDWKDLEEPCSIKRLEELVQVFQKSLRCLFPVGIGEIDSEALKDLSHPPDGGLLMLIGHVLVPIVMREVVG